MTDLATLDFDGSVARLTLNRSEARNALSAELIDARQEGGSVSCSAHVGDRLVAEGEIVFVHLRQDDPAFGAIDQKSFVFQSNLLNILGVGHRGGQAAS